MSINFGQNPKLIDNVNIIYLGLLTKFPMQEPNLL